MLSKIILLALLVSIASAALQSRARQNFNCDELLNRQIAIEFEASHMYLSASNFFAHDRVALHGFAKIFRADWKEELEHVEKLVNYGIMRGSNVITPAVPKQDDAQWESKTVCDIIQDTLAFEKKVNDHLHTLHKCADSNYDPQFQDFIESEFLKGQFEGNKELADLLTRLERATQVVHQNGTTSSTCDGLGLHLIDKELQ
ncbi:unnamed protein product [Brachionus calyciflorus]|uniref:Ferritin n=1 Tax=Brachionus calyciflorus TaxID=104777 RepID=A0A813PZM0_9BILA|nr:unnamed protein product [Brachionus calyciflorus]